MLGFQGLENKEFGWTSRYSFYIGQICDCLPTNFLSIRACHLCLKEIKLFSFKNLYSGLYVSCTEEKNTVKSEVLKFQAVINQTC